jgi:hypothetical protein
MSDGRVLRRPEEVCPPPRYDPPVPRDPAEYSHAAIPPQLDERHAAMAPRSYEALPPRFPARSHSAPDVAPAPRPTIEAITRLLEAERAVNPPLGLYAGPSFDEADSWD